MINKYELMNNRIEQRCKYIEKINYCQVKEGPHLMQSLSRLSSLLKLWHKSVAG